MLPFFRKLFIYIALIFIPFWIIGFLFFSLYVLNLKPATALDKIDGLAVLTGSNERIPEGLSLFRKAKNKPLLISGMNPKVKESFILTKVEKEAIPYITLGWTAFNTRGNAKEIKTWAEKNALKKVLLITSFYHIPRSLLEASFLLKNKVEFFIHPVFPKGFHQNIHWIYTKNAWFIFLEYNKFVFVLGRNALFSLFEKGV
ncbi:MAG: YdcF family protein [Alphaproteobacteria bacterium]|nr:YdcF family protein [Alphaproteobacteria bacterium]NCB49687.1 YdcF family protein [Alphaproteobacteria bacterium]